MLSRLWWRLHNSSAAAPAVIFTIQHLIVVIKKSLNGQSATVRHVPVHASGHNGILGLYAAPPAATELLIEHVLACAPMAPLEPLLTVDMFLVIQLPITIIALSTS